MFVNSFLTFALFLLLLKDCQRKRFSVWLTQLPPAPAPDKYEKRYRTGPPSPRLRRGFFGRARG